MSLRAIAAATGVSPMTVLRGLKADANYQTAEDGTISYGMVLGLDGKRRPSRRFDTTARDSRICELRDAGQSVRAIAGEVGCSVGTVHRVLKSAPSAGTVEAKQQQRTEWVEQPVLIPWSAETEKLLNRAASAGIEFTHTVDMYRRRGHEPTSAETDALIELAHDAISARMEANQLIHDAAPKKRH